MKINDVQHIAINTLNIEKSIEFYTKILKFELINKVDIGELVLVYIKIKENTFIELFDLKGACEKGEATENQQGLRHIAFDVEDIEAWNEHLKANDVKFVVELCEFGPIGKNVLLIEDPNGAVIELCEDAK